jgi:hypothetical protein
MPILRALSSRKRGPKHEFEKARQLGIIQRLLDATQEYNPERIKPLTSAGIAPEPVTAVMALGPATGLAPEPVAADIPCSLVYGSWRCRCPRCLIADKS